jgi:hypothetical protein
MVVVTVDVTHSYTNVISLVEVVWDAVLVGVELVVAVDDDVELSDVEEVLCLVVEDVECELLELVVV